MSKYNTIICKNLRDNCNTIWKRVEPYVSRRELPKQKEKIQEYISDLASTFNELSAYYEKIYLNENEGNQYIIREFYETNFNKVKRAFSILKVNYRFENSFFEQINKNLVTEVDTQAENQSENLAESDSTSVDGVSTEHDTEESAKSSTEQETTPQVRDQSQASVSTAVDLNSQNLDEQQQNLQVDPILSNNNIEMAQSKADFMKLAAPILNYKYDGDPLKLNTFLTDVELVEEMAEEAQKDLCFKFIKSKLEGRALEAMPDVFTTVEHITAALKSKIKTDSSRVISGKIAAMRLIKGNYSSFAKQAEELAESLRRSLVLEGMTKIKAEEIAIEETAKLCRKTSNNDIVKAVLSSNKFSSPSEVIAKFITESDVARQEYQQKQNYQSKKQGNGNKKFDKNKKGQFQNNSQNNKYENKNGSGKTYYNSKYNGNKQRGQNQRTETIRLFQGNPQVPSEGGESSSNAQGIVYQLSPN